MNLLVLKVNACKNVGRAEEETDQFIEIERIYIYLRLRDGQQIAYDNYCKGHLFFSDRR